MSIARDNPKDWLHTMLMVKRYLPNIFLASWALAAIGATVAHVFFTQRVANASAWGMAAGWQREIGYFDLVLASSAIYSILRRDFQLKRYLCAILPSLCVFLGGNHFATFVQTGQLLHLQWAILNALAIVFGFTSLKLLKNS